jgi:iron-sulfur cluster assembly accessory protein
MITLTPNAILRIKGIMEATDPKPVAIRIGVRGGGCSGFSYAMQFENEKGMMDKSFEFDGLTVLVDMTSAMYLEGATVDFVETLEESGFRFMNPNVKTTCGCGSSFSA